MCEACVLGKGFVTGCDNSKTNIMSTSTPDPAGVTTSLRCQHLIIYAFDIDAVLLVRAVRKAAAQDNGLSE
jgi:hypothetical protein